MVKQRATFCKWRIIILIVTGCFFFCVKAVYSNNPPKSILILNSYHKGLSWSDEETDGIMNVLNGDENKYDIAVEYMDWKHYPTQENLDNLYKSLKYKYGQQKIDLIVTADDAALKFALKNRPSIFSNAPIIFCGVNKKGAEKILQGYTSVTGVVEAVDPTQTIRAALKVNPNIKEVCVIFDKSESGQSTGEMTIQAIWRINPNIKIKIFDNKRFEDILKEVLQASKESILLITTYYMDAADKVIGFEDSCKLISENSSVPVYHLYDFGLGNGAIGGSMLSGKLQGEAAGIMALSVLQGENASEIPISTAQTTRYIFDYNQLTRFQISEDSIPDACEVINKPFSFFETYRSLVITILIIFCFLIVFIGILLFYINKINKIKEELYQNHIRLTTVYRDLENSDEKLKQQYTDLVRAQNDLKASEKQYALLFEKMLNGFFVFEPVFNSDEKFVDIRFINVNSGFENHTQIKASHIIGRTWAEVFGFPSHDLSIYQHVFQTGQTERFETYYSEVDTYYAVNAFKASDDQIGVVFDNITEYKMAIKEVKILNEELEQRVIERTSELQEAVNELEAFTYTVSHDLKSPLRAVEGYIRIIFEDLGEKLRGEDKELLENIRTLCKDMMEMIIKLLKYSTTTRSVLHKEAINIQEMFLSIANELKLVSPERDIRFVIETGLPQVYADRILLKQVIYNVLANAVKFTKGKEQAFIRVGNILTEEEYIFYIKDNGVGFDKEYSRKLFGIFQRLHTSDEFEGTGIGLATIKKIIQKHGGRVWIEGEIGIGATLYFSLPFSWEESIAEEGGKKC